MSKKKNLFKAFTQDVSYNYHIVKTEEPNGHLIYLIKNGSELTTDTLEFSPTIIVEELIGECGVKIEKFAPAIFFTEESNTEKLKYELNDKLIEDSDFSSFIETIKDEYRILEVKDSLLYKNDPEAYEKVKQEEHAEHQKQLLEDYMKQLENQKKHREEHIMSYNNDLEKLLKDYFEEVIEFEKRDFNFDVEFEKIINTLIDYNTWIKVDDKPFVCNLRPLSFEKDKISIFLTDNEKLFTATLRFDKTVLLTENVVELGKDDESPSTMTDYDFLAQLFEVNVEDISNWEFKNETDRFHYVIDFLVPIFKENKEKRKQEFIEKLKSKQSDNKEDGNGDKDDNSSSNKSSDPKDWYFDVFFPGEDNNDTVDDLNPAAICLSEDGGQYLDDQLGSHNLPQNIINALNRAGIYGDEELMEAMWEVVDSTTKTKNKVVESMKAEGFIYKPGMLN